MLYVPNVFQFFIFEIYFLKLFKNLIIFLNYIIILNYFEYFHKFLKVFFEIYLNFNKSLKSLFKIITLLIIIIILILFLKLIEYYHFNCAYSLMSLSLYF